MKQLKSTSQHLKELFDQNITAKYLAEPFKSFDFTGDAPTIKAFMEKYDYDVVGIRQNGTVIGYVKRSDLQDGICENYIVPFDPSELILDTTPLIEVFKILHNHSSLYIVYLNEIVGIVTKGDLQKSPARMWLFSLISLLEMQLLRLIRGFYPHDSWKGYLKQSRIDEAQKIFDDRKVKNESLDLADCLQFCDKRDIFLKSEAIQKSIGVESKTATKKLLEQAEEIRNNLAHAQDIITGFWPEIVEIAEKIETLLDQCERAKISSSSEAA